MFKVIVVDVKEILLDVFIVGMECSNVCVMFFCEKLEEVNCFWEVDLLIIFDIM